MATDDDARGARGASRLRMSPDAGSRARDPRRGGRLSSATAASSRAPRLGPAEPVRSVPRGAVRARAPRLRPVAGHEVPVVRRARHARPSRSSPSIAARASSSPTRPRRSSTRSAAPSSRGWRQRTRAGRDLLRHSWTAGPSGLEDLQTELSLTSKELKSLRSPLERCGAIVARSIVYEDPHRHTSFLARWDQAHPEPSPPATRGRRSATSSAPAFAAAVFAPEREPARWFSWRWYWDDALLDELADSGAARRGRWPCWRRRLRRPRCYTRCTTFHRFGEMGLRAHFL